MPWYQPTSSPPSSSVYTSFNQDDTCLFNRLDGNEEDFEFEGVGNRQRGLADNGTNLDSLDSTKAFQGDILYRRIKSVLSPSSRRIESGRYHDNRTSFVRYNDTSSMEIPPSYQEWPHPSFPHRREQRQRLLPETITSASTNREYFLPHRQRSDPKLKLLNSNDEGTNDIHIDVENDVNLFTKELPRYRQEHDGVVDYDHGASNNVIQNQNNFLCQENQECSQQQDVPSDYEPPIDFNIGDSSLEHLRLEREHEENVAEQIHENYESYNPITKRSYNDNSYQQSSLEKDKTTGEISLVSTSNSSSIQHHLNSSWGNVGQQISAYHDGNEKDGERHQQQPSNAPNPQRKHRKKGSKTKKDKRRPLPDIRGMIKEAGHSQKKRQKLGSPGEQDGNVDRKEDINDDVDDFVPKKVGHKSGNENKEVYIKDLLSKNRRNAGAGLTIRTDPKINPEPIIRAISMDTIREFSEVYHAKNAGFDTDSLIAFRQKVQAQKYVTWTMVFHDDICSTPFVPSSNKYCTPKGPRCVRWNCVCENKVRSTQSSAPLLGAMFVFPMNTDDHGRDPESNQRHDDNGEFRVSEEGRLETFLLPLGPTATQNIDEGYERMVDWPLIPVSCEANLQERWDTLRSVLMDRHVVCVTYNATVGLMPYHYHCANDASFNGEGRMDLIIPHIWDLRLASWMLSPDSKDEDLELDKKCAGFPNICQDLLEPISAEASAHLVGLVHAKHRLIFLYKLYPIVNKLLDNNGLRSSFNDIESPILSVLSVAAFNRSLSTAMECHGIRFKPEKMVNIQSTMEIKIKSLEIEARKITNNDTFLLSSNQQVSQLLFDVMKCKVPKGLSSKIVEGSQHRSTSEESLRSIQDEAKSKNNGGGGYRIIDIILEFRNLNKTLTTYVRPYPRLSRVDESSHIRKNEKRSKKRKDSKKAHAKLARIHPMWMQTAVRTGRLSCRKPNMQQIPTARILGFNIRDTFTASPKKCLFAFDYSQNEVRILAHCSEDKELISLFRGGENIDIYKQMSSAITRKKAELVTEKERVVAKRVCLAIMYGMGLSQVSKTLGVNRTTAQNFFHSFYGRFRGVKLWMDRIKEFARENKFVKTISGRRRYLDDIDSTDNNKKSQAERQAINTVIQGSAADLIKLAMLKISSHITDWNKISLSDGSSGVAPKILLQIHDELLFEVVARQADVQRLKDTVYRCCAEECVQEFKLKVPLKLKCSAGLTWGSMQELER